MEKALDQTEMVPENQIPDSEDQTYLRRKKYAIESLN